METEKEFKPVDSYVKEEVKNNFGVKLINRMINYFSFFRSVKIHVRLILAFILISIIPLVIIGGFSLRTSSDSMKNKISIFSEQLMEQLRKNMLSEMDKYVYLCDQLTVNETLQSDIINFSKYDDSKNGSNAIAINNMIGERALYYNYINDLQINTSNGDMFYDRGYDPLPRKDIERTHDAIIKNDGRDYWTYGKASNGANCIIIGRQINSLSNFSKSIGFIYTSIDEKVFAKNTYQSVNMGKDSDVFIIDSSGIVISSVNPEIAIGKPYMEKSLLNKIQDNLNAGKQSFNANIDNKSCLVVYKSLGEKSLYLVSTIPNTYIDSESNNMRKSIILVCTICILFSLILSFGIYTSILIPLRKIVVLTQEVIRGNFSIRIDDDSDDEMGHLSQKINSMIEKIKELIEQVKIEQKAKREKEIEVLQAQINPHFLFNTLNSLKWTAMMSRVTVVSDGIGALAELLRNTIIDNKAMITVKEELKNLANYIIIQKIRYGDSFEVNYDVSDEVLDYKILKFLLQSIIENSIIHGMDGLSHKIVINIKCYAYENYLMIIINDNGKGFDADEFENLSIKKQESKNRLANIGISNVRERIILNFGIENDLNIASRIGEGTTVVIKLPLIKTAGGD